MHESNRETIASLGDVRVCVLGTATRDELAAVGESLPLDELLEAGGPAL
jgi:hypothetical protein